MDRVNRQTRSKIMSAVGRQDTGPEVMLRSALHRQGLRYRLHDRRLPGSPDLVFPRFRAVVFVHGCYWHAHGCYRSTVPDARRAFWLAKFKANQARDRRQEADLIAQGWRVLIVWECALVGNSKVDQTVLALRVHRWLVGSRGSAVIAGSRA